MKKGTLVILVGIPGSGKSTFAEKLKAKAPNNRVIMNSDAIRKEFFGDESLQYSEEIARQEFAKRKIDVSALSEEELKTKKKFVCNKFVFRKIFDRTRNSLARGKYVIYDATNLSAHTRTDLLNKLKDYYAVSVCYNFPISVEEAVERDAARSRTVGREVIERMFGYYEQPTKAEGFTYINEIA